MAQEQRCPDNRGSSVLLYRFARKCHGTTACSPHCTIPSCQRQLLNLSNDSDNTHASNHSVLLGRLIGILGRWIGKWSIVALSQDMGSSGLSSVSGYNHTQALCSCNIFHLDRTARTPYSVLLILTLPAGYFKRTIFGACGLDFALPKLVPWTNFGVTCRHRERESRLPHHGNRSSPQVLSSGCWTSPSLSACRWCRRLASQHFSHGKETGQTPCRDSCNCSPATVTACESSDAGPHIHVQVEYKGP